MTQAEYIKYLEGLVPIDVDINRDYLGKFQKEARFMGAGWYEWGNIGSSNPRELILKGVLEREGVPYKDH